MNYTLYLEEPGKAGNFLTAASDLSYVKKDRGSLLRLADSAHAQLAAPQDAYFVIYKDGVPFLRRSYLGIKDRTWCAAGEHE